MEENFFSCVSLNQYSHKHPITLCNNNYSNRMAWTSKLILLDEDDVDSWYQTCTIRVACRRDGSEEEENRLPTKNLWLYNTLALIMAISTHLPSSHWYLHWARKSLKLSCGHIRQWCGCWNQCPLDADRQTVILLLRSRNEHIQTPTGSREHVVCLVGWPWIVLGYIAIEPVDYI